MKYAIWGCGYLVASGLISISAASSDNIGSNYGKWQVNKCLECFASSVSVS